MRHLLALSVIAVLFPNIGHAGPSTSQFNPPTGAASCTAGQPLADNIGAINFRPLPTAACDYDLKDVRDRIVQLMYGDSSNLSVESVESLFAIPQMTSRYDSSRDAVYGMMIYGPDGWSLYIDVKESFSPPNEGVAKFAPGLRPKRLDSYQNSTASVGLMLKFPRNGGSCPEEPFFSAALAAGWKDVTARMRVTDGGQATPTFSSPDGSRTFSEYSNDWPDTCVTNVGFYKWPLGAKPVGIRFPPAKN
jgi:hypothetical protein